MFLKSPVTDIKKINILESKNKTKHYNTVITYKALYDWKLEQWKEYHKVGMENTKTIFGPVCIERIWMERKSHELHWLSKMISDAFKKILHKFIF